MQYCTVRFLSSTSSNFNFNRSSSTATVMIASAKFFLLLLICALLAEFGDSFFFSRRRRRCSGSVSNSYAFNMNIAQRMVRYSAAAYVDDHQRLRNWQCDVCLQYLQGFKVHGIASDDSLEILAYTGYDSNLQAIVVAFRGTERNLANWLRVNFAFFREDPDTIGSNIGTVHIGFNDAYTSLQTEIRDHIRQLKSTYPQAPLYVTGHSLGGAMATLCALDLHLNGIHRDPIMINFGSPRVGNQCFVHAYTQNIRHSIRVAHPGDPITKAPFEYLGYRHVGRLVEDRSTNNHLVYYGQRGTDERR